MTANEHDIRNSTVGIKAVLFPYWKAKLLADQDWNLILSYLKRIESACVESEKRKEC